MLKLLLELSADDARHLLYLIHNTESMIRAVQEVSSGKPNVHLQTEMFADIQEGVLRGLSGVTESLENVFGTSEYKKQQKWAVTIDSKS